MNILITGGSGFVGSRVVESLAKLNDIEIIYLLMRDDTYTLHNFAKILQKKELDKIKIIKGDITQKDCAISKKDIESLKEVNEIYHLAANTSLSSNPSDKKVIFNVNIEGTRNVLTLSRRLNHLKLFYHFSTAYVGGESKKRIVENWLERPIRFKNYYEESKFIAESIVQEFNKKYGLRYIILRPSIMLEREILNPLKTKSTLCLYARLLRSSLNRISSNSQIKLFGEGEHELNIVLLDHVVACLIQIRKLKIYNKIFNITNKEGSPVGLIIDNMQKGFLSKHTFEFINDLKENNLSPTEEYINNSTKVFKKYLFGKNLMCATSNTDNIMKSLGLEHVSQQWVGQHILNYCRRINHG